jgi:predicted nucleic acid-binding protein
MKIYLDACVLSRLSDERLQPRVAAEAAAIEQVFRRIFLGEIYWSASISLRREVMRNPDRDKRNDALALLAYAGELQHASDSVKARAQMLHAAGYGAFDGLHLAHAESDGADALLTTDDRFIKQAGRGLGEPLVWVVNPVDWLRR